MLQRTLAAILQLAVRLFVKPILSPSVPVAVQRRWTAMVSSTVPPSDGPVTERSGELQGGSPVFIVGSGAGEARDRPAVLWAHGGGFVLGGRRTHGALATHLSAAAGADVYLPEYRMAPEHPFPAAVDDLFEAWQQMLDRGHDPARTAIGGDSAGGALAVLTALALREMDVPGPRAMVLISPVTDLSLSGPSIERNRRSDAMISRSWVQAGAEAFAGEIPLSDPRVSPMFADLEGLPPTLIQVVNGEILLDDSLQFADRAWAAGVEVEVERFDGFWHDFQMYARLLDAANAAVDDIGGFLRRRWAA